ncbi:LuxR family transcriptional regulator [Nocardia sp. MH4]|jgi:DNA-binding CsgD family transcriptional regulator|uniref:LuxR family transcriptional regulator n=1 Tax=Nocardia TaxID=1817 RepID=UPI001C4FEB06|nr:MULTISPECIES: LuxR family transcriptional regulator [Nocardia]MBW0270215.1 LuxR family transcriptional regulator [Nocardia sp. MH4]
MSIALQRFSNLIAAIYAAGNDPDRWDSVIGEITDTFGAVHGFLVIADPAAARFAIKTSGAGCPPDLSTRLEHIAERVQQLPVGSTATSDDLFAVPGHDSALADQVNANGLSNSLLARLSDDRPSSWICLTMPDHQSITGHPASLALLRVLVPHLRGALRTQSRLVALSRDRALALATLEQAHYGIMIVTTDAAVVFANSMAERITRQSDGLSVDTFGCLRAGSSTTQLRLRSLIDQAAGPDYSSGNVAVARNSGRKPLILRVSPLDGIAGDGLWDRAVLLLVADPDHDPEPEPTALHDLYGLTDAETLVAMGVLRGDGLPAVADQLSVSVFTARTHLQHIFAKTKTHRQAELVRLLLTTAISAQ